MPEYRRSRALIVGASLALLVALFSVHYTVERGDTLGEIAKEHGVSATHLERSPPNTERRFGPSPRSTR